MKFKNLLIVFTMWAISTSAIAQWIVQNSGLPDSDDPTLVFSAVDSSVCWGIQRDTINPVLVRTLDGGDTWEQLGLVDSLLAGSSIFAMNADTAWITLYNPDPQTEENGGIWKTTDGGQSWVKSESAFTGRVGDPAKIYFFDSINGLCIGNVDNDGGWRIYTTQDGGAIWSRVPPENIPSPEYIPDYTTGAIGCAVGSRFWFATTASLYRTTDMGLTWSVSVFPEIIYPADVAFKDSLNGLLTVYHNWDIGNELLISSDGGETWTFTPIDFDTPSLKWINHVPGTNGNYFVTSNYLSNWQLQSVGGSAYTTNDGIDWTIIDALEHGKPEFVNSTTGWSAGRGDTIFKWSPGTLAIDERPADSNDGTLGQNYPNPFHSTTTIQYNIHKASRVVLKVYDIHGSEVATLVDGKKSQGTYSEKFGSSKLSSGIYYYRLQVGDNVQTRKLVKF